MRKALKDYKNTVRKKKLETFPQETLSGKSLE